MLIYYLRNLSIQKSKSKSLLIIARYIHTLAEELVIEENSVHANILLYSINLSINHAVLLR